MEWDDQQVSNHRFMLVHNGDNKKETTQRRRCLNKVEIVLSSPEKSFTKTLSYVAKVESSTTTSKFQSTIIPITLYSSIRGEIPEHAFPGLRTFN